jgi:hypothetical protein
MLGLETLNLMPRQRLLNESLDFLQLSNLFGTHQRHRHALLSCTTGSSNTVNIVLGHMR